MVCSIQSVNVFTYSWSSYSIMLPADSKNVYIGASVFFDTSSYMHLFILGEVYSTVQTSNIGE